MAINLVQVVSSFLTPEAVARFANAVGVNPAVAQTLVNAALPAILAALGGAAATPAGAQRLSDQVGSQDPGLLDNLAATLAGPGRSSLATSGSSLLSSLIGSAGLTSVVGALSRATGADSAPTASALGLLTPVALASIGRQDPSLWSSGKALGDLFAGQRGAIQQAMPAGLGSALAGLGLPGLSSFAAPLAAGHSAAQAAASTVQTAARDTADTARAAAARAERAAEDTARAVESGAPGWLWPAVAIVALAVLAWWFMGRSPTPEIATAPKPAATTPAAPAASAPAPTQQTAPATQQAAPPPATPAPAATAGVAPDVSGTAASVAAATVGALQQTLAGVTDAASAKAAEAKLKEAASQVDKASAAIMALPEAARKTVATQTKPAVGKLQEQVTKLLGVPGVGDVLKPILDPIMSKLNAIAGA